jgi:hypothetical protein
VAALAAALAAVLPRDERALRPWRRRAVGRQPLPAGARHGLSDPIRRSPARRSRRRPPPRRWRPRRRGCRAR